MKKVISLFLAVVCMISIFSTMTFTAAAAPAYTIGQYMINEPLGVNLRKGAGISYSKVTAIPNKKEITVTAVKGSWGKTTYKGKEGWICLEYTKYLPSENSSNSIGEYKILPKEGVNIRTGAGTKYKKVGAVSRNTIVNVTSINNNWGYIRYKNVCGWICLDYAQKITTSKTSTTSSTGITSSAYKKTGIIYTIDRTKYYQAKTTRAYNGVAKNTVFYVDSKGVVVNNATTLNKLYTLESFNNIRSNQQNIASLWTSAARDYYDICTNIAASEKMGTLIGTGSGLLLSIGSGNSVSVGKATLELSKELFASSDTVKSAVLLALIRVYANNTIAYGNKASSLMKSNITDFDTMLSAANAYADCCASFTAVDFLAGEQVREMANSSTWKQLSKYFYNVFCGLADSVISDFSASEIKEYIEDGIALGEIAIDCGAVKAYNKKLSAQNKYLSATYTAAKTTADKLSKNEWNSLVGRTVASIKNGSSYTAWYNSSKNISAKGGYIGECTWYVLGRFGEVTGVKLTKAPHAKSWLSTNKNNPNVNVVYGANKIVPQCIAVDTSGRYGHTMFIEHVEYNSKGNPQTVYFTECNWDCNSTYNVGKDCVVKKLSYSQFVAQRGPDGYIIAK